MVGMTQVLEQFRADHNPAEREIARSHTLGESDHIRLDAELVLGGKHMPESPERRHHLV